RPGQNVGRGKERPVVSGHHWVPIDDDTCMVWNWHYSYGDYELSKEERLMNSSGNGPKHVDFTIFRAYGNRRNDWLIDREVQRTQTFSGIDGVNSQDRAVQESMGFIVDRSREHLGPADRAIIAARKLLLEAVRSVERRARPRGGGRAGGGGARARGAGGGGGGGGGRWGGGGRPAGGGAGGAGRGGRGGGRGRGRGGGAPKGVGPGSPTLRSS